MPKILPADAIRHFHEEGYLPAIPVLSPEQVAYYRGRLEAFEAKHPADVKKLKTKSHILFPWVQDLAREKRLLDVYEDLIGPDILCYSMAWRIKNPDGKTFAWGGSAGEIWLWEMASKKPRRKFSGHDGQEGR